MSTRVLLAKMLGSREGEGILWVNAGTPPEAASWVVLSRAWSTHPYIAMRKKMKDLASEKRKFKLCERFEKSALYHLKC